MAITVSAFRNGASLLANAFGVGFIDWLDGFARKNTPTFLCDMLSLLIYYSIGGRKFTCLLAA